MLSLKFILTRISRIFTKFQLKIFFLEEKNNNLQVFQEFKKSLLGRKFQRKLLIYKI